MKSLISKYFNSKEKYLIVFEILTNIFNSFADKVDTKKYKEFGEILDNFLKFVTGLLTKDMLPSYIEQYRSELILKGIENTLLITQYYNYLVLIKVISYLM